jgi:hypothetical protein
MSDLVSAAKLREASARADRIVADAEGLVTVQKEIRDDLQRRLTRSSDQLHKLLDVLPKLERAAEKAAEAVDTFSAAHEKADR